MNFDNLLTVAECDAYMAMFRKLGSPIPPELMARRERLLA